MTASEKPWAKRIRSLRLELATRVPHEYSQAGVARRLNVDPDTVRAWETGRSKPRKAMARRLARVLGVKVEELHLDAPAPSVEQARAHGAPARTDDRPVLAGAIIPHPGGLPAVLMSLHVWHAESAWSWLGGHVRPGEEPEAAVRRELGEELEVQGVRVIRLLGVVDTHIDTSRWWGPRYVRGHLGYHFLVTVESPDVRVADHEELTRVEWLTLDRVAEAVAMLPEEIREADMRFAREAVAALASRSAAE